MRVETVYPLALMALYLCKMEMNYINKVQLITVDLDTEDLLLKNFLWHVEDSSLYIYLPVAI